MAADVSGGHGAAPDPSWWNMVAAALGIIGAPVLFQKLFDHLFGRRKHDAEADLIRAQARKTESEADDAVSVHAAEFEKAVNERVKAVLDSWEKQVTLLTARVQAQQDEIRDLRDEVVELRKALDAATKELHAARANAGFGQ